MAIIEHIRHERLPGIHGVDMLPRSRSNHAEAPPCARHNPSDCVKCYRTICIDGSCTWKSWAGPLISSPRLSLGPPSPSEFAPLWLSLAPSQP